MSYWNAESALQQEYHKRVRRRKNLYKLIQAICVITSVILVCYPIVDWTFNIRPTYYQAIGKHVDEAERNYEHPEIVQVYIEKARSGIAELGLELTDNSALYNNAPSRKVAHQHIIFDSIIQRCDELIQWREENLVNFGFDLYELYLEKLEDLKTYMYSFDDSSTSGRYSDWIAFGAYLNKTDYPFLYRMPVFQIIWVAVSYFLIDYLHKRKQHISITVSEQIRSESNVRVRR